MSRPEVLIIGSGPGGSAAAWSLARSGTRVTVLEAGPAYDPSVDYRIGNPDWETGLFPAKRNVAGRQVAGTLQSLDGVDDALRSWNRRYGRMVTSERRAFAAYHHVMGVGGSTLHYTGESQRLHPEAMSMHRRFGVAADWPFDYAALEPYYQQAEEVLGVSGPGMSMHRPRSHPLPLGAHAFSYASQVLQDACRRRGMNLEANTIATPSAPYRGRPQCNYCGQCSRGCSRRDKGSADLTFMAEAVATGNCELRTGCEVLRLEKGANDRVRAVLFIGPDGRRRRLEADHYVLACGAVETPRLLLNSGGLANESGLVGRNFMETLYWVSVGLHPDRLDGYRGLPSDAICWDFNAPDAIDGVIGGVRLASYTLDADLSGPLNHARRVVSGWGRQHKQDMQQSFGHALAFGGIGEHLPNERSFIDLDPQARDAHGMPRARINSHMTDMDLRRTRFMADTARAVLEEAGVDELVEEYGSADMFNSTHVFGTCRMGHDPETSVVDADCRSHRWRNLSITDASVFPSSGGGESPSLSIYAVSLRAARRLKETA